MSKTFVPLHVYTSYSLLKSGLTLEDYLKVLKANKLQFAGISDINHFYGMPSFSKECKKNKIKPVFGLDVVYDGFLLSLYIKDEIGYQNLIKISNLLTKEILDDMSLKEHQDGLILVMSTIQDKLVFIEENKKRVIEIIKRFALIFDDFYLGLDRHVNSAETTLIRQFANEFNYKLVAFPHIKYIKPKDALNLELANSIANQTHLETDQTFIGKDFFPTNDDLNFYYTKKEINLTFELSSKCEFILEKKRGTLLEFPHPNNETSSSYLKNLCLEGLKKLNLEKDEKYLARLNHELQTINKMGFDNYFLIVADYVSFARTNNILVGPGRGSAPGSLVSYSLGITKVDPIKYNLLFERFLNESRETMPDIDIDFADWRRDDVVSYIRRKYGDERVANIITFQSNAARQSIRDIGRIYNIEIEMINYIVNHLGRTDYNLRDNYRYVKAFRDLVNSDKYYLDIITKASKIEGLPRQTGIHAAGVILNNTPLIDVLPLDEVNGHNITQYEMGYLEEQGFLKMDLLGLTNLTTIEYCLSLVNKNYNLSLTYNDIPYDDPSAFKIIADGHTIGIFQLESAGMNNAINLIKPSEFEDIVALLALHRPGPMEFIPNYAKRKNKQERFRYLHKDLIPILESTYGIIVYQEQIMQIAQVMAGMNLKEADLFRRAISKKDEKALSKLQDQFVSGALKKGYSSKDSNSVFNQIYKFADYGFNRSHSLSYAVIACQMAYLKATYPHEFYASLLRGMSSSTDKFYDYVREMKKVGITLELPSVNHSELLFKKEDDKLRIPLQNIKDVSLNFAQSIIEERTENGLFESFRTFVNRMSKRLPFKREDYVPLIEAGACDCFGLSRNTLNEHMKHMDIYLDVGFLSSELLKDRIEIEEIEDNIIENIENEYKRLGVTISGSLLINIDNEMKKRGSTSLNDIKLGKVDTYGIIKSIRKIKTRKNEDMAFMTISNYENEIDCVLFPETYANYAHLLQNNTLIQVKGKMDLRNNKEQIIIDEVIRLDDLDEKVNDN